MKIQILGTGCAKCKMLEENAVQAVKELGVTAEIEKITEIDRIMDMGVMITPALAVDDGVKSAGKVLTLNEIKKIISEVL